MICKGNTHQNGTKLARYITTPKEGEHVVRGEIRGFATEDITKAFQSVHVMAEGTRCEQQFRAVVKALTQPEFVPDPKPHRRRKEDTGGNFSAAQIIFRRVARFLPLPALNPAWEPFTWLRLWDYSERADMDDWGYRESPASDLSPGP